MNPKKELLWSLWVSPKAQDPKPRMAEVEERLATRREEMAKWEEKRKASGFMGV